MAVKQWSQTAGDNDDSDPDINWLEGMAPGAVNNSARAMMSAIAAWYAQIDGGTVSGGTVGGSASAITLTCSPTVDARAAGQRYLFKLGSTITGATTLAVDGLAAGAIQWNQAAIVANDFAANDWIMVADDGTNYQLITPPKLSAYAQINNLTADGTGATGDKIPTYDVSTSLPKYILISTLQTLLAASAAQQETGTSTAVYVTPGVQARHPSATKASVNFTTRGTNGTATLNSAYNVASVTRTGTGAYTVAFTTAFSSANYTMASSYVDSSGTLNLLIFRVTAGTTSCTIKIISASGGGATDLGDTIDLIFTGDQ